MSADTNRPDDVDEAMGAEQEEAAEAAAEAYDEALDYEQVVEGGIDTEAVLAEARHDVVRARAFWSLVHKELLAMLLANCFFFAGALVAWARVHPWGGMGATPYSGLETIRGAAIFGLSLFGFWIMVINVWHRQLIVWPYLLNALLALWVGIPGFTNAFGSEAWDRSSEWLKAQPGSHSFLEKAMTPLSNIAPGYWLLTAGGALVLIVLVKGILGGASQSRAAAASEAASGGGAAGGRRRRR